MPGLPGAIIFSKVFLSFTKNKFTAEKFLNSKIYPEYYLF